MGNRHNNNNNTEDLTEKQVQFLLDNTSFDREQIDEWHKEFLKECPNGRLKRQQFEKICQQQSTAGPKEIKRFAKYAFLTFDKDGNKYINYTEFVLAIAALSSGDMKSNLLFTFKMYDINNDGSISKSELKRIIKALYKLRGITTSDKGDDSPSKRVKLIFEKYDKSNDNRISEREFIDACLTDPMIYSLLIND